MRVTKNFVFFWGHEKDQKPFSNWYPCKFTIDGIEFNCTEQHMMYHKALTFGDHEIAEQILKSDSPSKQKKLGRKVDGFDADVWAARAKEIVYNGNKAKYTQTPDLMKDLLETHQKELVEASPYDAIWGIGMTENDPSALDKSKWMGTNWLGEVLTKLRNDYVEFLDKEFYD